MWEADQNVDKKYRETVIGQNSVGHHKISHEQKFVWRDVNYNHRHPAVILKWTEILWPTLQPTLNNITHINAHTHTHTHANTHSLFSSSYHEKQVSESMHSPCYGPVNMLVQWGVDHAWVNSIDCDVGLILYQLLIQGIRVEKNSQLGHSICIVRGITPVISLPEKQTA